MSIQVKFFASLREVAGVADATVSAGQVSDVAGVWAQVCGGRELPSNVLAARNMEYVGLQEPVVDGDEVAFFPPVTGGAQ